jgi:hypothetical protein
MSSPDNYRLLVPDGWFRISLEPGDREQAITALVGRQFRGMDNVPHLKEQARRSLRRAADGAYANGGIEMYVSLQAVAGIPLSASLVITLTPPHNDQQAAVTPERLASSLTGDGREVTIVDLHAGPAVRVLWQENLGTTAGGPADHPSTSLDVHVPVPESTSYLILSFRTPLTALAGPMTGLFDSIASTLRWVP